MTNMNTKLTFSDVFLFFSLSLIFDFRRDLFCALYRFRVKAKATFNIFQFNFEAKPEQFISRAKSSSNDIADFGK